MVAWEASDVDNSAERIRHSSHLSGKASELLEEAMVKHMEIVDHHDFGIVFAFGYKDKDKKSVEGIDIFSARLRDGWEGNPMYDSWTFENGVYVPREKGTTCGIGLVILGEEEKFRRLKKNMREFLYEWPDIGELYDPDFFKLPRE